MDLSKPAPIVCEIAESKCRNNQRKLCIPKWQFERISFDSDNAPRAELIRSTAQHLMGKVSPKVRVGLWRGLLPQCHSHIACTTTEVEHPCLWISQDMTKIPCRSPTPY